MSPLSERGAKHCDTKKFGVDIVECLLKRFFLFKWYINFRARSHDPKGDTFDQVISANMCLKMFLNLLPFIYLIIIIIINFWIITHISFHWLSHPFIIVMLASNSLFFFYSFFFWFFVKGELAWMQPCDPDMQLSAFILIFLVAAVLYLTTGWMC